MRKEAYLSDLLVVKKRCYFGVLSGFSPDMVWYPWKVLVLALHNESKIGSFLSKKIVQAGVAPRAAAGVATWRPSGWLFQGGATWQGGLEAPFDLASCTKPFIATLCAELESQGRLTWTTLLGELLPDLEGRYAGGRTIEELLSHRSGLAPHRELFRGSWNGESIKLKKILREVGGTQRTDRGKTALYSDLGYILVGAALECLGKQSLDQLLATEVLASRKLRVGSARMWRVHAESFTASVVPTELQPQRGGVLRGVVHDDNAWVLSGNGCSGHAGLFAPLGAVLRFGAQTLDAIAGRLGERERNKTLPLVSDRPGGSLKMGFDGVSHPGSSAGSCAGKNTFGHLGFTGTSLWCDPDQQKVVVLLSNRVAPTRSNPRLSALRPEIHDFLWGY